MRGCLTNALNPKIGVFYVTFLPQFIPAGADVMRFSLLLAAVHAVLGMLWFGLLVAATRPLARWLSPGRHARAGPDDGRGVHRVRAEAGAGETLSRKLSMAAASASGVSFIG